MRFPLFSAGFLVLLASCHPVAGRDFSRPDLKAPERFRAPAPPDGAPAAVAKWWDHFHDRMLSARVEGALAGNPGLAAAELRVRSARSLASSQRGGLWPVVDTLAAWLYLSDPNRPGPPLSRITRNIPVDVPAVRWDLDIFGGTRRSLEISDTATSAAHWRAWGVRVALAADTARAEIAARGFAERLRVAKAHVDAQAETLKLAEARFAAGLSTEGPVADARAQLAALCAVLPPLREARAGALHRLAVLCGMPPGAMAAVDLPVPGAPDIPPGLPSDTLRRRPDVALAEAALHAATAQIGVEEAELYPRFALSSGVRASVDDPADLFKGGSYSFSIGPSMRWRLFDRIRIKHRVAAAGAAAEASLRDFDATVLAALEEVENALAAQEQGRERVAALEAAVRDAARGVEVARALYEKGLGDFDAVLRAQTRQFDAEDALVDARVRLALNAVTLYQALGGGWEEGK